MEGVRSFVQQLPAVWVEGEIDSVKTGRNGQVYFTLKDRKSQMSCVVWGDDARRMNAPEEGLKVFARGFLTVFANRGSLQFTVKQLLPTSEGGFHALKLARAREALEKDGLFAPERKRALPEFPGRIGVITSGEGAAWHDIVAVVQRRWPFCELVLIAARVQGAEAPGSLVRALELANRCESLDVLIVGRGGGSKEDLSAFNEERVARAVAASRVPTISAVGHEIDITLTDLVADVRAPTPSAAAEKAVPDRLALLRHLEFLRVHLGQAASGRLETAGARLSAVAGRMEGAVSRRTVDADHRLRTAQRRMSAGVDARLLRGRASADRLAASLDALSPLKVLGRGYSVARDSHGHALRSVAEFPPGTRFRLRVTDGEVAARSEAT
jgi:exodeoxyribonuclease VII large subunit